MLIKFQMKPNLFLLALLLSCPVFAQVDYSRADAIAATFDEPYANAADLAKRLTQSFQTEEEKARVIFMWIAHNIRYDCAKFKNPPRYNVSASTKEELVQKRRELEEKEMAKSLKGKRGVCSDYSAIFKAMCDAVGLESVVILGDARDFYRPYRNNQNNSHAWNAVKIDGKWHLMDATWAAGFINPEVTKFTRRVSPGYFKTPPSWFVQSHLPDDEKWQLLEQPLNKKNFPDQALINYGQLEYPVLDFSPAATSNGKYNIIRLKFAETPKEFLLTTGNSRPVTFEKSLEDGWVVLRFAQQTREVTVFGGESAQKQMGWLARYEIK